MNHIAGVDEAGRGPLVGAVVAAAVILNPRDSIHGLRDSKKLSAQKREYLFEEIKKKALCFAIAEASASEIDQMNILQATLLAMQRCVEKLFITPTQVFIDGNRCPLLKMPSKAIIGGDDLEPSISAASILAKVTRDRQMELLDKQYPQYGFAQHKGYPTKAHLIALQKHGIIPVIYRTTYGPVKRLL